MRVGFTVISLHVLSSYEYGDDNVMVNDLRSLVSLRISVEREFIRLRRNFCARVV